ncbi:MAG TPA: glycosyl transferase [Microscillaceae bacterium]|nr:glycosyl transferase [Microscillaceae bacterium]
MKVSGFSFVRNAVKLDYPIVEAITSVLPICDEFVIAVGKSEDDTLGLIRSIGSPKIRIIETEWDDSLREGGRVLAVETDKAFAQIAEESDWAFYIQGDEVIHEKYLDTVKQAMLDHKDNPNVDGLLFKYKHFYGSYDYVADSRVWYRREIRVVRNRSDVFAYRDAQGFRKKPNDKLRVKFIDAYIYHYGWVREPDKQQAKQRAFHSLWKSDEEVKEFVGNASEFDYSEIDSLALFKETHPKVMQPRIDKMNWKFDHDLSRKNYSPRIAFLTFVEKLTGWRIGEYRNYKIV